MHMPVTDDNQTSSGDDLAADYRHQRRETLLQDLFACTFDVSSATRWRREKPESTVVQILDQLEELDELIQSAAPERPLSDINKVDLAILRLIMFESKHKKTPKKVLLNEAIELAKTFGSESSHRFVNGVLAKLILES